MGSFLALAAARLPEGRGVVAGRSHCEGCGRALRPHELVPLLSYLLLRGRCARCGAAIPAREPLVELAALGIGLWAALSFAGPAVLATALLGWWLLLLALLDGAHFWLPEPLTLGLLGAGLAVNALLAPERLVAALIGAAAGFLGLAAIALAYRRLRGREGLGGGDARLLAAAGAWVGWMGLPSVLLLGALAGLSQVAARLLLGGRVAMSDRLPFGAHLALGTWLTWLYGPLGA